ncbi:class I SAM-dependent methyltransferase [Marispirochaeta sp.]|jgi:SAM-dependent methyltransferase|uniref:class I SAM-dependent methyltransferase n=1 Tax=Marispirochaeta sp. TaxID=2038653 RepID=UPI0029C783F5|nr:class I SAM-dependent methyltransferase [Marispirochaeta sp.]
MDNSTLTYYQKNAAELARRYEQAEVPDLHLALQKTFPAASRLLEIGCGTGREASFMYSRGYDIICIEPSRPMLEEALCRHPELENRLFEGYVPGKLPEDLNTGESYDGVYAVASLMHLQQKELAPVFKLIRKLLKPGGGFLFSVPLSRPDLIESGYDTVGRFFLLISEDEWICRLEEAGFRNIRTASNPDGMGRGSITWLTCVGEKYQD